MGGTQRPRGRQGHRQQRSEQAEGCSAPAGCPHPTFRASAALSRRFACSRGCSVSQKQNGRDGNAALCSLLLPSLLTCAAVRLPRAAEPRGLLTRVWAAGPSRAHVAGPWWGWGRWCPRGRAVSVGCACPQPAGAAAAALPAPEGAGAGREAGGDAAHLLPLLPVPRHAELPARHAQGGERGSGRGARGLRCRGRVAPRSPRLGAGARARRVPRQPEGSGVPCSFQLLASMSQCLSVDPLSFSVWRQLYTKHLAQSRWVPAAGGAPAR